jgi:hypothetical protein
MKLVLNSLKISNKFSILKRERALIEAQESLRNAQCSMYRRNKAVVEVQFVEAKEAEIPRKLKVNLE